MKNEQDIIARSKGECRNKIWDKISIFFLDCLVCFIPLFLKFKERFYWIDFWFLWFDVQKPHSLKPSISPSIYCWGFLNFSEIFPINHGVGILLKVVRLWAYKGSCVHGLGNTFLITNIVRFLSLDILIVIKGYYNNIR